MRNAQHVQFVYRKKTDGVITFLDARLVVSVKPPRRIFFAFTHCLLLSKAFIVRTCEPLLDLLEGE